MARLAACAEAGSRTTRSPEVVRSAPAKKDVLAEVPPAIQMPAKPARRGRGGTVPRARESSPTEGGRRDWRILVSGLSAAPRHPVPEIRFATPRPVRRSRQIPLARARPHPAAADPPVTRLTPGIRKGLPALVVWRAPRTSASDRSRDRGPRARPPVSGFGDTLVRLGRISAVHRPVVTERFKTIRQAPSAPLLLIPATGNEGRHWIAHLKDPVPQDYITWVRPRPAGSTASARRLQVIIQEWAEPCRA